MAVRSSRGVSMSPAGRRQTKGPELWSGRTGPLHLSAELPTYPHPPSSNDLMGSSPEQVVGTDTVSPGPRVEFR